MLDTFASVGVTHFDLKHLDIDGEKRGFRKAQSVGQLKNSMPFLIESASRRQNNVIIRPRNAERQMLVQLDDLDVAKLKRVEPFAFITITTSPGNHQAWVVVSTDSVTTETRHTTYSDKDFARRLRKGTGADVNASGATRIAGTLNYKRKYWPDFPVVHILSAALGRIVVPGELVSRGLVAPAEERPPVMTLRVSPSRTWPDYQRCIDGAPPNQSQTGPDISRADYFFAMLSAQRGHSIEDIAARLMDLSSKAKENGERYVRITAENATAATERQRRSRS